MGDSVACSAGWGRHLSPLAASAAEAGPPLSHRERVAPVRHKRSALHPGAGLLRPLL